MRGLRDVEVLHGDQRWMVNLGTFRGRKFTYAIFLLVLVMLGAVVIACLIPIYPQEKKTSAKKSNLEENPLF